MGQLVLSLFPGLGFLDRAFEAEGFTVVRGPDVIWGGDIREFHPPAGRFDGVIGGPPCQAFSKMAHLVRAVGNQPMFGNLIPEFERCVAEAQPRWFVMENVQGAPLPAVAGYQVWCDLVADTEVGGSTSRVRRISVGMRGDGDNPFHFMERQPRNGKPGITVLGGHGAAPGQRDAGAPMARMPLADMLEAQGFPGDMLDDCPLTSDGKRKAIGNGVPYAMGRAIAKMVATVESREPTVER